MRITNCGRGVHQRELPGIDKLKNLPPSWYAYTNLDVVLGPGRPREVDVIIVADDRLLLVDLKDWRGKIENPGGRWTHKGRDHGLSPVAKISQHVREVYYLLSAHLKKHAKGAKVPLVQGVVVITGGGDFSGVTGAEAASVFEIGDFIKRVSNPTQRVRCLGPAHTPPSELITSGPWKHRLGGFFNTSTGPMRPGARRYGNFVANSEASTFEHSAQIYAEYDVVDEHARHTLGTLRLWDFTRADTRFQNEEGRAEIAGRERAVVSFIADRSEACAQRLLAPVADDPDRGVSYWEIYERRQRLRRLSEFAVASATEAGATRIELARQLISAVADLHGMDAAHLDLAGHSVWLEAPTTVRLSHLMAAHLPEVRSLGAARYQFLSSAHAPDGSSTQTDPMRRDVYLLGVCVHQIVFGTPPALPRDGVYAWDPAVDATNEFSRLQEWFETVLAPAPEKRFESATAALAGFNKATEARPTRQEIIEGLETFRQGSQKHLVAAYPETESLRESDRLDVWRSETDGAPVLVKMWKAPAWGDTTREGARLLAFLEQARDLKLSPQAGCARVRDVRWLGDAIALVLVWAPGCDLAHSLGADARWHDKRLASEFLVELIRIVQGLHDRGRAHGDIKPQNIVADGEESLCPTLIDLVDFSAAQDGDIVSNAYAPRVGSRQERDRFAVTRIAEEVLARVDLDAETTARLAKAIRTCMEDEPKNSTLLPLGEALQEILKEPEAFRRFDIAFCARNTEAGEILSDEGWFFVRRGYRDLEFVLRGAFEEVKIGLDARGEAIRAERRRVDQKRIGKAAQPEFFRFTGSVSIRDGSINELSPLRAIFQDLDFASALAHQAPVERGDGATEDEQAIADEPDSEAAEDRLAEEIVAEQLPVARAAAPVDVKRLWRALMDTESAMTNEAIALDDSYYDRRLKQHVAPIELVTGGFDFDRKQGDSVIVQRQDRQTWRRIGALDLKRLDPEQVFIDGDHSRGTIIRRNQRLKFVSNREWHSRRRRESAIDKVLSGEARIADLADVFANPNWPPETVESRWNAEDFNDYGLNEAQKEALKRLLSVRPVGLVQGPPGTGKTVFIAALIHFVLTHGLARNVLLASQSHEAVNTAAEAVLKLYRRDGQAPSMLRVGDETVVSDALTPFHSQRVEQAMKDRFRAETRERLQLVAGALALPSELAEEIVYLEMAVRPLVERLAALGFNAEAERRGSLKASLTNALQRLDLADVVEGFGEGGGAAQKMRELAEVLRGRANTSASADGVARFRQVAQLASDFIGSSSGGLRNFEPLLAGTRQIVVGTCVGLGRPALGLTKTAFDLVIIDEAARCTASELAVPMQAGRWVVLVGDHAQLEPQHPRTVVTQVARETGIAKGEVARSDFERIFSGKYGQAAGRTLTTQYRMLAPIGRMVSATFYKGCLEHGRAELEIPTAALPRYLEKAVGWLATDELGKQAFQKSEGSSLYNPAEEALIVALLEAWQCHDPFMEWIEQQQKHGHAIGVICTYASQRDRLQRRLDGSHLKAPLRASIKIDTVDAYQGKENPIVLLSLVRHNADGGEEGGVRTIREGFLSRPHRINVAMSRAMDRLLIVGARSRWRAGGPMEALSQSFQSECERGEAQLIRPHDVLPDHAEGDVPKMGRRP
ncbi:MAG: AAA domain-containing protein [Vitreimonas sp.]